MSAVAIQGTILLYGDVIVLESSTTTGWVSGGGFIDNLLYLDELSDFDIIRASNDSEEGRQVLPPTVRDCCFRVHPKYQFSAAKQLKKAQNGGIQPL